MLSQLWAADDELLFVTRTVRRQPERAGTAGIDPSPAAHDEFLRALAAERLLISTRGAPYLYTRGEYRYAGQSRIAAQLMLVPMVRFAHSLQLPDLRGFAPERIPNAQQELPYFARLAQMEGTPITLAEVPRSYGEVVNAAAQTGLALAVDGLLSHPIAGEPRGAWVQRRAWRAPCKPRPVAAPYPHLRRLFSALPLDPGSHALLHIFLLGAFHAVSLESEKPLLFLDSWKRGRGKSEVTDAIQILLEGSRCAVEASPGRQAFHDSLIAHLVSGARVVPVHNLDGRRNYNNETFATIATEGGLASRPKYGRESERFLGILPIFNGVYGAFSLHKDFLCRCFRVELPGEPQELTTRPRVYATEHRDEIIAEILAAHRAEPGANRSMLPVTRFAEFEAIGARAYSAAFSLAPFEVRARIETAQKSATGLLHSAVQSLHLVHPGSFESANEKVVGRMHEPGKKETPPAGASALGFTFNGDTWDVPADAV